jgi:hypothetical protein
MVICESHQKLTSKGNTSMSRTVSFPVAIAIRLVLEGKIKLTGENASAALVYN